MTDISTGVIDGKPAVKLPSATNLSNISTLLDAVRAIDADGGEFIFDAEDLEGVSTPLAQLLIAAERSADAAGKKVRLHNCAPEISG